nr:HD domain-containing protein [Pukyongiella litopenaei]
MFDVAAVAEALLACMEIPPSRRDALVFLIALHDLGKIGVPFREMLQKGLRHDLRHWEDTEVHLNLGR